MLIGGISPHSKVVTLSCKFLRKFVMFKVGIFFKNFDMYFAIKVTTNWWNFFYNGKSGKCQNNTFCQIYHITTFEVAFYHPSGLTEYLIDKEKKPAKMNIHYSDDTKYLNPKTSTSSWFHRFTISWNKSLEPSTSFGILEVLFNPLLPLSTPLIHF